MRVRIKAVRAEALAARRFKALMRKYAGKLRFAAHS